MSAFGGKADIGRKHFNVRFGSKADIAELRYNPTADRKPARMGDEGKAVSSHVAGDLLCETYTIEECRSGAEAGITFTRWEFPRPRECQ